MLKIRAPLFIVAWICLIWTKLSSADDLTDIGRCVASMSLYDADRDWYLDENEFIDVFLDIGKCAYCERDCTLYKELACACLDYDDDMKCCARGIARLGTYPVEYTNTVCKALHEAANRCGSGAIENSAADANGNSTSPVKWQMRGRLLVAASLTSVLVVVSSIYLAWKRWNRRTDEASKDLTTHSALGIASRSTDTYVDHEATLLCNGWMIEPGSPVGLPWPPSIQEEPSDIDE